MTLRLTIDEHAWRDHVAQVAARTPGLVPVVKGNGYGFGRPTLAAAALGLSDEIAVGTVHELADVVETIAAHPRIAVVALTPAMHLPDELPRQSVPTVGSIDHVEAIRRHGWHGSVAVKLESSMHRHGVEPGQLAELLAAVDATSCQVHQFVLHLPLPSASFDQHAALAQVEHWLTQLDTLSMQPTIPVSLSHLDSSVFADLRAAHPTRVFRLRSGTSLWHGDKSFLHLAADILAVRRVSAGEPCGYHQQPARAAGHLVVVGAGSANGVVPLDGGLSPFHFRRRRMELIEPPHMHASIALLTDDVEPPPVGDWVDVQRPLISVSADVVQWT